MTTSLTSFTFSKLCFVVLLLPLLAGENIKMGGLALNTLKKLKGLKFTFPSWSIVLAKAMGLGAIAVSKSWCSSWVEIEFGSIVVVLFIF